MVGPESVIFARNQISLRSGRAIIGVQAAIRHAFVHVHAVEAIQAKGIAQAHAQHRHDDGVIQQIAEWLAPIEKAGADRRRSVPSRHAFREARLRLDQRGRQRWRAAETRRVFRRRQVLLVDESVERIHLVGAQGVFDNQIALQIKEILLKFHVNHVIFSIGAATPGRQFTRDETNNTTRADRGQITPEPMALAFLFLHQSDVIAAGV